MVCMVLAACSLSVVGTAGAVEPSIPSAAVEAQGTEIIPMANRLALNDPIVRKSESWEQETGYGSYRVSEQCHRPTNDGDHHQPVCFGLTHLLRSRQQQQDVYGERCSFCFGGGCFL